MQHLIQVFLALTLAVLGALAVPVPESLSSTPVSGTALSQTYGPSSSTSSTALPTTTPRLPTHLSSCSHRRPGRDVLAGSASEAAQCVAPHPDALSQANQPAPHDHFLHPTHSASSSSSSDDDDGEEEGVEKKEKKRSLMAHVKGLRAPRAVALARQEEACGLPGVDELAAGHPLHVSDVRARGERGAHSQASDIAELHTLLEDAQNDAGLRACSESTGRALRATCSSTAGEPPVRKTLWEDVRVGILPALIDHMGYAPIPPVEYTNAALDLAHNYIHFSPVRDAARHEVTSTFAQIQADMRGVAFWFRTKSGIRMSDPGRADVVRGGQGVTVRSLPPPPRLFPSLGVADGSFFFAGDGDALKFSICDSKHDLFAVQGAQAARDTPRQDADPSHRKPVTSAALLLRPTLHTQGLRGRRCRAAANRRSSCILILIILPIRPAPRSARPRRVWCLALKALDEKAAQRVLGPATSSSCVNAWRFGCMGDGTRSSRRICGGAAPAAAYYAVHIVKKLN
ncbi:hypothetical protein FB451DRAFT_1434214 [Mycena latifolia]|nr:hypothetical protein FB451DRAFT_1434214 [Mycena latifolia]